MVAGDLMHPDAPTLSPDDDLPTAAEILTKYEHSVLPVVDEQGTLVGMVTEEDVLGLALPSSAGDMAHLRHLPKCYGLRDLGAGDLQQTKVADIMRTEDLVTVEEDELAAQAALLIIRHGLPQLPVVSGGKLVGRICRKSIIMELVNPSLGVTCQP